VTFDLESRSRSQGHRGTFHAFPLWKRGGTERILSGSFYIKRILTEIEIEYLFWTLYCSCRHKNTINDHQISHFGGLAS